MNGTKPIRQEPIKKEYLWGTEEWILSYLHEGFEDVPLLVKKICAREALSVQVHPDDAYAKEHEGSLGKTEMWYVLDCEPGAYLYYGLKHQISENEFKKRIQNGSITEVCKKVYVKKGDVFYIPAGVIHAIGKGITILEVQQSSNITYRIYDYQREDANHQKRELHIRQASEICGFSPLLQGHRPMGLCRKKEGYYEMLLVQCPYFSVYHYLIKSSFHYHPSTGFSYIYVVSGTGTLETESEKIPLNPGDSYFIPEKMKEFYITGNIEIIMSEVAR